MRRRLRLPVHVCAEFDARSGGSCLSNWVQWCHAVHPKACTISPLAAGPLLVTQQLHKQGLLGSRSGSSLVANMTSKVS